MIDIETYAQRLLNPFRGTMHVLRYASAEAVTLDGLHWDIYVSNDELARGLESHRKVQVNDIRFGAWSADSGLRRGPIYPSDDFRRMEAMGDWVYQCLPRLSARLPFPLRDCYELWLLDALDRPLALLQSALSEQEMEHDCDFVWRAGTAAREKFHSMAVPAGEGNAADALAKWVNHMAGPGPTAQWFCRDPDGSGLGLRGVGTRCPPERRLPKAAFPALLLGARDEFPAYCDVLADFQAWQAVWLLALPGLEDDIRQQLERATPAQAALVEGLFRLYPKIIDAAAINAARVEARILKTRAPTEDGSDRSASTFHDELNPAGGAYT